MSLASGFAMLKPTAPAFICLTLLSACGQGDGAVASVAAQGAQQAAQTPEQKANATASAGAITGQDNVLQLAIPVEVSATGVRVMGDGQVIRAPSPQPGAGPQLVVTLEGQTADGRFQRQYELPDPRLSEVEGQGQRVRAKAQMFVYVELADRASRIDVKPKSGGVVLLNRGSTGFGANAKSSIDLTPIATKVCRDAHQSSPLCQQTSRR